MTTASATVESEVTGGLESAATRIVRILGKAPVYLFLVFVGLLWLVPTIGLLFTSLLAPRRSVASGWWHVITQPSLATVDNYRAIFENDAITSAIWTTLWISLGGDDPPDRRSPRSRRTRSPGSSSPGATGCSSSSSRCSSSRSRWR